MSNDNWYSTNDWYAPLKPAETADNKEAPNTKKKKKGLTPARIAGILVIVVLLIIGSSVALSGTGDSQPVIAQGGSDLPEMPVNPEDFFESYYQSVQTDIADIDIKQAKLPIKFDLALNEAGAQELELKELYKKCAPSIVSIAGYKEGSAGYAWGTGVILSSDGLILTNTHVIDGCNSATVTLYDDRQFEAMLVGADSISDIAVLKINTKALIPAEFGESGSLEVGEKVAAIGNPLGEDFRLTLTDGIISAIERGIQYNGHSMSLIQTNTAINEGNSGGALFNMYGQVIGITNMKMMGSYSSIEGIGFAIPSGTVREVVNSLVLDGRVNGRPSIGVTVGPIPENAASAYDMPEGLYVSDVSEDSDAKAQGIMKGDVLVEVNGQPVRVTDDVLAQKEGCAVGESMHFKLWRDGEYYEVDVKLVDTNDIYK